MYIYNIYILNRRNYLHLLYRILQILRIPKEKYQKSKKINTKNPKHNTIYDNFRDIRAMGHPIHGAKANKINFLPAKIQRTRALIFLFIL